MILIDCIKALLQNWIIVQACVFEEESSGREKEGLLIKVIDLISGDKSETDTRENVSAPDKSSPSPLTTYRLPA